MPTLSVDDYIAINPEDSQYVLSLCDQTVNAVFIKWEEDSVEAWGGPWEGNYVLALVIDYSGMPTIQTKDQVISRYAELAVSFDEKEMNGIFHVEKPIKLILTGNDDASYSMVYATTEEAILDLRSIILSPSFEHITKLGFVFTN